MPDTLIFYAIVTGILVPLPLRIVNNLRPDTRANFLPIFPQPRRVHMIDISTRNRGIEKENVRSRLTNLFARMFDRFVIISFTHCYYRIFWKMFLSMINILIDIPIFKFEKYRYKSKVSCFLLFLLERNIYYICVREDFNGLSRLQYICITTRKYNFLIKFRFLFLRYSSNVIIIINDTILIEFFVIFLLLHL